MNAAQKQWIEAQRREKQLWDSMDVLLLFKSCTSKLEFLNTIDPGLLSPLFDGKEVLEVGVGPPAISVASLYGGKEKIKRLVKTDPLPPMVLTESAVVKEAWAEPFIEWAHSLSREGEYVQSTGEEMLFSRKFHTIISLNVLDHTLDPLRFLQNAYRTLRQGGRLLLGVDCYSLIGRLRFEHVTRRTLKGSILVDAHPHSFLPHHVVRLLEKAGFHDIRPFGVPSLLRRLAGPHFMPAFVGRKG